jgi:hypothetical protein
MIWLIIMISVNGAHPQVINRIPYDNLQACEAEKALRDNHPPDFQLRAGTRLSIVRKIICSDNPGGPAG